MGCVSRYMSVKCNKTSRLLSSYLDRQLSASGGAALEQHLGQCRACRDELDRLSADRRVLTEIEAPIAPPDLDVRVMAEIRSRAALRPRREHARAVPARPIRDSNPSPVWVRVLAAASVVIVIGGSACAGVALGSSLARFGHRSPVPSTGILSRPASTTLEDRP